MDWQFVNSHYRTCNKLSNQNWKIYRFAIDIHINQTAVGMSVYIYKKDIFKILTQSSKV
jgi:hypothetical protein